MPLKAKSAGVLEDGGAVLVGVFIEDDPGRRSHQQPSFRHLSERDDL
jgi:hypothetical protein